MSNWLSHLRVRDIPPGVWALGIVSLLMDLSSEIIHALLPLYLVTIVGVSMLTIGIIEGVAEAIAQIVKMFSGALSDRLGRRKLLAIIGYGLAAITKPIFPLATTLSWLIAARFIDRVGKGIRGAPRDALIADLTPEGARGASFGLRQSLDTIGAFLGPLAAILIMAWTANNFTIAFWIAVIPAFAAVAVLIVWVKEPKRAAQIEPVRSPLSRSELKALPIAYWFTILVAAIFTLARFSEAFLLLRAQAAGITLALIPAFLVVMNVFYALSSWPAGALSDRIGRYPTAMAGFAILIAANLVLALSESVALIGLGVALWGLHMGLTQGVLSAMVADHAPPRLRGSAFGLFHLVTGLTTLLASVIAGGLWQWFGPQLTFLAGAGFTLAALLLLPFVPSRFGGRAKA